MIARLAGLVFVALQPVAFAGIAQAQRAPSVSVGRITSQKSCTLYQQSAGRSGVVITPDAIGAYSSWRTWLVRDCVDNFRSIRTSIEAALAASGNLTVRSGGAGYVVTGRISDVSGGGGPAPEAPETNGGFSIATNRMFVNMDVTVRDPAGRIVFGGLLTKHLETGSDIKTSDFRGTSSRSGEAIYTQLQHEVALAVARMVAFKLVPLVVVGGDGRQIRLNYGAPLLTVGTVLEVSPPDRGAPLRYNVVSGGSGEATAELDGGGDPLRVAPGSTASVIEADDPAANTRRYQRVELP